MSLDVQLMTDHFTQRPVWAEINLDAAAANMHHLRQTVGPDVLIASVVKANAYGHGAVEMAKTYLAHGANELAVAYLDEGVELRRAGITAPIFILGHTDGRRAAELIASGIDAAVFHETDARCFSQEAVRQHRSVRIHIAVDTGMGRIGFLPSEESIAAIKRIAAMSQVVIAGMFTHFSVSDMADEASIAYTKKQYQTLQWFYRRLREEQVSIPVCHCCSSAALLEFPDFRFDMVRPGIIQYGCQPSDEVVSKAFVPQPVMSLHCGISHIKVVEAGETISYGRHFTAQRRTKIATLPIGYADGYSRLLSNKAYVLVHGCRVPQVGNICMDQCMIDVTDVPEVAAGDEVVLFGTQGGEEILVSELAHLAGTIEHEILCNINRRVPRLYVKNGQVVHRTDYLKQQ